MIPRDYEYNEDSNFIRGEGIYQKKGLTKKDKEFILENYQFNIIDDVVTLDKQQSAYKYDSKQGITIRSDGVRRTVVGIRKFLRKRQIIYRRSTIQGFKGDPYEPVPIAVKPPQLVFLIRFYFPEDIDKKQAIEYATQKARVKLGVYRNEDKGIKRSKFNPGNSVIEIKGQGFLTITPQVDIYLVLPELFVQQTEDNILREEIKSYRNSDKLEELNGGYV